MARAGEGEIVALANVRASAAAEDTGLAPHIGDDYRSQPSVDGSTAQLRLADRRASGAWKSALRRRLLLSDVGIVFAAVTLAQVGRFGIPEIGQSDGAWMATALYSVVLAFTWLISLGIQQAWDIDVVGTGPEEYRRVVAATAWVFGAIASTALIFQLYPYIARGYLVIALPAGLIGLLLSRNLFRRDLVRRRLQNECNSRVLVLGQPRSIIALATHLGRNQDAGYTIVGACVPRVPGRAGTEIATVGGPIPVLGDEWNVETALLVSGADALAVTGTDHLGSDRMQKLSWRLDSLGVDLIVVPGMSDIAGPRLKIRPIDNLPLFHVSRPRHDRAARARKRTVDLICASLGLLAVLPLMIATAVAIKLDDGGPIFFRQVRVGFRGEPFRIFKFRTMFEGSDRVHELERASHGQADVIFYKSANDSRITRVGRFLRRTSLDELPQLLNVITGSMSLVGPRPLVPGEGASVEDFVERRSLIKPGLTGLWQVSGRSDVSPEERVRLDYSYIDNWSSTQDFVIMWRTLRAVLKKDGAY